MPRNCCLLLILLFTCQLLNAQLHTVSGKVTNQKLEPLAFASVQVKTLQNGTLSKEDGSYSLKLDEGRYELVISMIGFKSQIITVIVNKDIVQNISLDPDEAANLAGVMVKSKLHDRSEEFIRNIIRHKENILAAPGAYSCDLYIRAVQKDSSEIRNKNKKQDTSLQQKINAELSKMSMAEISVRYDQSETQQVHEQRSGVSKRGNPENLFYLSATEGDFNLYNDLIRSRTLASIPFISPVSYSGLLAYRFKMVNIDQSKKHKIYTISFKPRQLSNATVDGQLEVEDSTWVILSARFQFPRYQLPEYDFFEVTQQYEHVKDSAWMISKQSFTYYSKSGKDKISGQTVVGYSNFSLNRSFSKNYFGNEVSVTEKEAYKRDSSFWNQTRTEPLSKQEIQFIRYKDSIYYVTHTEAYLDSLDRVINKTDWKKIGFTGQELYNHKTETTWVLPAVLDLYQPLQFGGTRINPTLYYARTFPSKKTIQVRSNISYGIRNQDVNGSATVTRMYNPFNRGFFRIAAGREFQEIYAGDAWINQLKRSNYYLGTTFGIGHGLELANGLMLTNDIDFSIRRSVSDYKTNAKVDSLFGDLLTDNHAIAFTGYNALYGKIKLQYTPFQKYIREPDQKIILGSKWPTFYTLWRKGISGIFNSTVNFDYLESGIEQQFRIGTAGTSSYTLLTGIFPNTTDLRLVDFKFQRRGDPLLFSNPNEAFQALDSTFAVFSRFYQGHYLHEFNGYLLNRIPLLKKLRLREVAGGGFLIAPERNLRYAEIFTGVERVFKWPFSPMAKFKIGFYVVGSAANQFRNPVLFKFGITTWDRLLNKWQ